MNLYSHSKLIGVLLILGILVTGVYLIHSQQNVSSTSMYNGPLRGTSAGIGGLALLAGSCSTGTASVPGASVGSPVAVSASDGTNLAALGAYIHGDVTAQDTVTVSVCAIIALTPTRVTYNVVVP